MALTINNPQFEARLKAKAEAQGLSEEAYVEILVQEDNSWGELPPHAIRDDDERAAEEIWQALGESDEQIARGETLTLAEFDRQTRTEHDFPR
ncbi:MAG: hypothetical protein ACR2NN_17110 [Bryobacteraceae bacterium]